MKRVTWAALAVLLVMMACMALAESGMPAPEADQLKAEMNLSSEFLFSRSSMPGENPSVAAATSPFSERGRALSRTKPPERGGNRLRRRGFTPRLKAVPFCRGGDGP